MGFCVFMLGGLLGISGMIALWIEYRICYRIVQATKDMPDGLKPTEIWLTTLQFQKWKKLRRLAASKEKPELQKMSRKAIRLEVLFYILLVSAMILMAWGAMFSSE